MTTTVTAHEAEKNMSRLLAEVEAGGEVVIMRHKKPVAKIVALDAKPAPKKISKYVQRTYSMGAELVDLTKANQLLGEMDVMEFLKLDARLQKEAKERAAAQNKPKPAKRKPVPRKLKARKVVLREIT